MEWSWLSQGGSRIARCRKSKGPVHTYTHPQKPHTAPVRPQIWGIKVARQSCSVSSTLPHEQAIDTNSVHGQQLPQPFG